MSIFAIGDLHLPGGDDKPMDVFGAHWEGHWDKIRADWHEKVRDDDIVLIPGDISWAMQLEQALPDLGQIAELPGIKVLLRGNHDYWWSSLTRVREVMGPNMYVVQNDAYLLGGVLICGSRGWTNPQSENDAENIRLYRRELMRLQLSLDRARQISTEAPIITMTHYPPVGENGADTEVSALLSQYGVQECVYGHLHGGSIRTGFTGMKDGVNYHLVSCDSLGFQLKKILD